MKRIVWDMGKCTGCRVCEAICSLVKEGEFNPVKARAKVVRTVERSILHKVRVTCLQCEEPNCKAVCPTGAITLDDRGVKVTDEDKCIGCKMCVKVCPADAVTYENNLVNIDHQACIHHGPSCEEICVTKCPRDIFLPYEGRQAIAREADSGLKMAG
mgnify:CR=1 FL=1